jgi:hypothetical protein
MPAAVERRALARGQNEMTANLGSGYIAVSFAVHLQEDLRRGVFRDFLREGRAAAAALRWVAVFWAAV